jgi:hypothetical protein
MSKFNAGDRVFSKTDVFTGTVSRCEGKVVYVARDDGRQGLRGDGLWSSYADWLELIGDPVSSTPVAPAHKHIMGLDPESIDWEAHKTFIKGL